MSAAGITASAFAGPIPCIGNNMPFQVMSRTVKTEQVAAVVVTITESISGVAC